MPKADDKTALFFAFFSEVAIIAQLSGRMLEAHLPDGFLASHFAVLNHLARLGDGRTPLAIARAFQVPKATMTHTLSGLSQAKLVQLVPNPDDGRSKCVMLTEKGRRFRDDAIARLAPAFGDMMRHFDAAEIAALMPVLARMRAYLDAERSS